MVVKIDLCNVFVTEKDVVQAIGDRGSKGYRIAIEGFADVELFTVEGNLAVISDLTDDIIRTVSDRR